MWLQYVVQGGAIVLLAVVLFGVWRLVTQLVEMLKASTEYIREATAVQTKLCERVEHHEKRAAERHDELLMALRGMNGRS